MPLYALVSLLSRYFAPYITTFRSKHLDPFADMADNETLRFLQRSIGECDVEGAAPRGMLLLVNLGVRCRASVQILVESRLAHVGCIRAVDLMKRFWAAERQCVGRSAYYWSYGEINKPLLLHLAACARQAMYDADVCIVSSNRNTDRISRGL
jgi:hypothetical protein